MIAVIGAAVIIVGGLRIYSIAAYNHEKNIFDVIAEAEQMGDLYDIDQRPSHIDGFD